jgi:hypothetical protein
MGPLLSWRVQKKHPSVEKQREKRVSVKKEL